MTDQKFIPLMVPDIQQQDIDAVVEVLKSGMLIQGKKVEELEKNIAEFVGAKHVIAVSNGTATMHLALVALGIGEGDEVIVPALSYVATANVVELVGATPVFVDTQENTFNINADLIEAAITSKTKAIIPVHEFGLACDITRICEIAKSHNLFVIEDAACALGATENGKFAGTLGDIGSYSLHPRKAITSGEGGLIVTNNDALADKLRVLRNHGIKMVDGTMNFVEAGFNYRMTDFQAALVNSQLHRLSDILTYKNKLATIYFEHLSQVSEVTLPKVAVNKVHTWQSFHVLLESNQVRDFLIQDLKNKGVGVNYGAQCIPAQEYYTKKYNLSFQSEFPNAWRAYTCGLVLPLYERLNEDDITYIANSIHSNWNKTF